MRVKTLWCLATLWLFLGVWPVQARLPLDTDYSTLASAINTDPALTTFVAERNWTAISSYYNTLPPSPASDFWVLRESLALNQIYEDYNNDGVLWDWAVFFTLPLENLERWRELFRFGTVDPRKANLVSAITTIMPGAPYATLRTFLLSIRRRLATRGEALFTTGTGNGSTGTPSITRLMSPITENDVCHSLGLCPLS